MEGLKRRRWFRLCPAIFVAHSPDLLAVVGWSMIGDSFYIDWRWPWEHIDIRSENKS